MTAEKIFNSLQYVVQKSKFVSLNYQAIDDYVSHFSGKYKDNEHWTQAYPLGYKPRSRKEDEIDFLFLIDSQAFCFWGYPKKWTIDYKGKKLDGWWALIACFERALENHIPILEGKYLASMSLKEVKNLFAGQPEIPLLKKRKQMLNEIGKTLLKKYQGRFYNFFKRAPKEAFSLLEKISREFSGFDDVAQYQGKKVYFRRKKRSERVYFYKKAQLVIADISFITNIKNVEQLPGKADYKIPALLRKLGILEYEDELARKIDQRKEIKAGSEAEIEIRANMLWAIHLLCQKLRVKYPEMSPSVLDGILWLESQKKSKTDKPYHLTRTIYY